MILIVVLCSFVLMLPASTFLRGLFLEELEKESSLDKELALDPQTSVLIINKIKGLS